MKLGFLQLPKMPIVHLKIWPQRVVQEVLTIPLHSFMKEEFIQRVIDEIKTYFIQ